MPIDEIGIKVRFETDGEEKVERALNSVNKQATATSKHFQNLAQTLVNMGTPYATIVNITGAAAASTAQYSVNVQQATAAILQLNPAVRNSALVLRNQQAALNKVAAAQVAASQKSSAANAKDVQRLALLAIGTRTLFSLMMKLRREVSESIQTVFGATEEWKRYELAVEAVKLSATAAAGELVNLPRILEFVATKGMLAAQGISAMRFGLAELASELKRGDFKAARLTLFDPGETDRFRAEGVKITAELMEKAADESKDFERALESLYQLTVRYDQELERNAQALEKVNQAYNQAEAAATGKMFSRLHQIELDYQKSVESINQTFNQTRASASRQLSSRLQQIQTNYQNTVARIEASALKSRLKAFADFERRRAELQQQAVDNRAQQEQQQMLEREFAQRRFQLSQMQSDRIYQADRAWLVGEGDVLAIERLDERHGLEQQAQAENFRLQQEQAEAMFQLQLRFQEQALQQQIAALQEALQLQLAAIEESRAERVQAEKEQAEQERQAAQEAFSERLAMAKAAQIEQLAIAKAGRAEEIAEAKQAYADQLATAKAAQIEQTNDLQTQLKEREKAMAESLAELIRQNELSAPLVMAAWRAIFGPNGEFDLLITQAVAQASQRLMQLQAIMQGIAAAAAAAFSQRIPGGGPSGGRTGGYGGPFPVQFRAQGGDDIVSSPTLFVAGEAGPERVITQPLGRSGGNISVSWGGGAIPVQGRGLEGADVSGIGDSIVEGLMIRLSDVMQNAREVR